MKTFEFLGSTYSGYPVNPWLALLVVGIAVGATLWIVWRMMNEKD